MSNVRRPFLAGAILLFASQLFAQICPTGNYPALRYYGPGCPNPSSYAGSPCTVGSAVTLSLIDPYSGAPYSLQSCETGVAWTFGDGSTAQTTAATVQHTYATGGQFNVTAIVQSGSSRFAYAYLLTATGTLSFGSVPPDVTEGGTSSVNVHTTYAPTSVSYQVYDYRNAVIQYTTEQVTYNTDCCGISVQFHRFGVLEPRSEFRVAFSVANISTTLGNLKKQDRLF